MMLPVARVDGAEASPLAGRPVLDWPKAAWNGGHFVAALVLCPWFFAWDAVLLFVVTTYATLLIGHSVGMHRMLIHRSFRCGKGLERMLVYLGVLVGVAGPFGIVRIHDLRDWAQRQPACHDFFAHRRGFVLDLFWQLACRFAFQRPPRLTLEPALAADRWYRLMERSWRWHQLLLALPLYLIGGWGWVAWGVCARVFVSTAGHWSVTYHCHNPGPGRWRVRGAAVQASNLRGLGLLTYGECWHNNHHAFPESARIGLHPGQIDPGWWLIRALERGRLAWDVGHPRPTEQREDLVDLAGRPGLEDDPGQCGGDRACLGFGPARQGEAVMTKHYHWAVWIDHREARLVSFSDSEAEHVVLHAHGSGEHLHHRAGVGNDGRAPDGHRFYETVAQHLATAGEILLAGPGTAKTELMHHLERKHPALAKRVVKVETLDHPTDGQLLALARKQFKAIDRMLPRH